MAIREATRALGEAWFSPTVWQGRHDVRRELAQDDSNIAPEPGLSK